LGAGVADLPGAGGLRAAARRRARALRRPRLRSAAPRPRRQQRHGRRRRRRRRRRGRRQRRPPGDSMSRAAARPASLGPGTALHVRRARRRSVRKAGRLILSPPCGASCAPRARLVPPHSHRSRAPTARAQRIDPRTCARPSTPTRGPGKLAVAPHRWSARLSAEHAQAWTLESRRCSGGCVAAAASRAAASGTGQEAA
jgi:hypothetical protein